MTTIQPKHELIAPTVDPTPIFELFRGNYATNLLTAAVAHFDVFGQLAARPLKADDLGAQLQLERRASTVLFTALRAMGLIEPAGGDRLTLSPMAREHLVAGGPLYIGDYVAQAAHRQSVVELVERLRTNRAAWTKSDHPDAQGTAFTYRDGVQSAMDNEESARRLTLALAGRAKNVAPALAQAVPMNEAKLLIDVGGGTGLYAIAFLQKNPELRAVVYDRGQVLKVASQMGHEYRVADRLEMAAGDMFVDALPKNADVMLLSNVLHDWDVPECRDLVNRCAGALNPGGRLLIHDVFLNDAMDGPLPIALYSVALFSLTEGRAYSAAEYSQWLRDAGLSTDGRATPTLVHCGVLVGTKAP